MTAKSAWCGGGGVTHSRARGAVCPCEGLACDFRIAVVGELHLGLLQLCAERAREHLKRERLGEHGRSAAVGREQHPLRIGRPADGLARTERLEVRVYAARAVVVGVDCVRVIHAVGDERAHLGRRLDGQADEHVRADVQPVAEELLLVHPRCPGRRHHQLGWNAPHAARRRTPPRGERRPRHQRKNERGPVQHGLLTGRPPSFARTPTAFRRTVSDSWDTWTRVATCRKCHAGAFGPLARAADDAHDGAAAARARRKRIGLRRRAASHTAPRLIRSARDGGVPRHDDVGCAERRGRGARAAGLRGEGARYQLHRRRRDVPRARDGARLASRHDRGDPRRLAREEPRPAR